MSMNVEPTDRVAAIFSEVLNRDVPSVDTDLFESGVLDSLAFVELLLQLEREYGVTTSVEDLDADNFRTIACIAQFVAARTAPRARVVPFRAGA
jgi:D-alanine--poly(phosphoribitol) ligase subunit 2